MAYIICLYRYSMISFKFTLIINSPLNAVRRFGNKCYLPVILLRKQVVTKNEKKECRKFKNFGGHTYTINIPANLDILLRNIRLSSINRSLYLHTIPSKDFESSVA